MPLGETSTENMQFIIWWHIRSISVSGMTSRLNKEPELAFNILSSFYSKKSEFHSIFFGKNVPSEGVDGGVKGVEEESFL